MDCNHAFLQVLQNVGYAKFSVSNLFLGWIGLFISVAYYLRNPCEYRAGRGRMGSKGCFINVEITIKGQLIHKFRGYPKRSIESYIGMNILPIMCMS